ncbi:hypothetical protein V491_05469 [Pseudogymnoascus sp. VKM F-3775]|nr:hypothetical protein V491_05469 [Pseudogymnoascus sp. VKM F-3775]
MLSSNWRQPTVDEDWDSCPSETTNNSTTPPPKYSSLNVADNIGAGSNSTFRQEYLQDQRNMDLETGHIQPANTPLGWYTQICNRIPVRKIFNNIPIKQICSYMTLENIFSSEPAPKRWRPELSRLPVSSTNYNVEILIIPTHCIAANNCNTRSLPYFDSGYIQVNKKPCVSLPPVGRVKTWWGCGSHIPSVMDNVPEDDRCTCEPKVDVNGTNYPPKAASKN